MIKYATIGTGWITSAFISAAEYAAGADMKLEAVYSRDRERCESFAGRHGGARVHTDLYDLADDGDVDAVYVASPNSMHYAQSKLMLESGKHVICEKPITVTPYEFEELSKLALKKGLVYMEAIMYMFSDARRILRGALNEIGTIRSAQLDFSQLSSKYPALLRGETPNIFNPKFAAGALMDLGIYCVYPAIDIFGRPKNVGASAVFLRTGADACGSSVLIYEDKLVSLTWSKTGQSRLGSQIIGDKGTVTVGSISQLEDIKLYDNDGNVTQLVGKQTRDALMGGEAAEFCRYINEPEESAGRYRYLTRTTQEVCMVMSEIRRKAGIVFGVSKFSG